MALLFDAHAHFDDAKFDADRYAVLDDLFMNQQVGGILNASISLATCEASLSLADRYPGLYAACGIYPENVGDPKTIPSVMDRLREVLSHPKAVAVGEIGLDFHEEIVDPAVQKEWFAAQLALSEELNLPVQVHDREAHGACLDMIRAFPKARGMFHSFSGSPEMAKELVSLGWYVSFSGVVTFKNAAKTPEAARIVPEDRILIETDCPYLTPHPFRGQRNHSGYVRYTAEKIADLRGITYEAFCETTERNFKTLFGIS